MTEKVEVHFKGIIIEIDPFSLNVLVSGGLGGLEAAIETEQQSIDIEPDDELSMYVGGACPYCGKPMTRGDLETAITSDVDALPCHQECWAMHIAESD